MPDNYLLYTIYVLFAYTLGWRLGVWMAGIEVQRLTKTKQRA